MDNFSQVTKNDLTRVMNEVTLTSDGRYTLIEGDQGNVDDLRHFLNSVNEEIDFMVDDGGHTMHQQQLSFAVSFPYIRPGGYYVIEDLHTSLKSAGPRWGINSDRKNTTLSMLETYQKTGKIESTYMDENQLKYLETNIDFCEVWISPNGNSITSMIRKNAE
jgi:hypothetical protein